MTKEKINGLIAEICGWEGHSFCTDMAGGPFPGWDTPPDYCNCLNAMHEAEKMLNQEQKERYFLDLMCRYGKWPKSLEAIQATAQQRAETFLRTLGKWEED